MVDSVQRGCFDREMDSPEQKFFVSDDGKEKLSITKAELQAGIDSGKYGEKTLAWTKGMGGWLPLTDPSWEKHGGLIRTAKTSLSKQKADLMTDKLDKNNTVRSVSKSSSSEKIIESKFNQLSNEKIKPSRIEKNRKATYQKNMTKTQANIIIILLLAALGFPLFEFFKPAKKWEYLTEFSQDVFFETTVDRHGDNGWELVFARRASDSSDKFGYECIFKRPK